MPSIPQSLLWISLVVLWLFVLVPMLINKRDAVRRTSDIALATRVLNSASGVRKLRRPRVAAGHGSDPTWRAEETDLDGDLDDLDDLDDDTETGRIDLGGARDVDGTLDPDHARPIVFAARTRTVAPEPDYLDVDVVEVAVEEVAVEEVEDAGVAEPAAPAAAEPAAAESDPEAPAVDDEPTLAQVSVTDARADDELPLAPSADADTPVVEATATPDLDARVTDEAELDGADEPEPREAPRRSSPVGPRRHPGESAVAAAVTARKYTFRTRAVAGLVVSTLLLTLLWLTVWPSGLWSVVTLGLMTLAYLGYLRRQTRIEQRLRQRRAQRLARSRAGVENTGDREYAVVPSRLRRPGATVLEIDDEDPAFEHLEHTAGPGRYHLPRAAGQ